MPVECKRTTVLCANVEGYSLLVDQDQVARWRSSRGIVLLWLA
jgi:hypothetical protein